MNNVRDLSVIKEIANASSLGLETDRTVTCRSFVKYLSEKYRIVRSAKEKLCGKADRAARHPGVSEWLNDNFYLIHNEYEMCKKQLGCGNKIPCIGDVPRVSRAFLKFSGYADFAIDNRAISEIMDALDEKYTLITDEYFFAKSFAVLAIISSCASLLSEYMDKPANSVNHDKYTIRLGDLIESVRCISLHRFDADIMRSTPARILSRDPDGSFGCMTVQSRIMYLQRLSEKARSMGITEKDLALDIIKKAENGNTEKERHVGYYLMMRSKLPGKLYIASVIGLSVIITLALSAMLSPLFVLAYFPIWEAVRTVTDHIFSKMVKSLPLPRMELSEVPDKGATLVVITSLLGTESSDSALFDRLERIFLANNEKNVYFGMLADLRDSKTAKAPGDEKTTGYAYGRTEALNAKYGKKFILFERRRSYSKSEEIFMGWERKRGAVCELVNFLKGKSSSFSERSKALASEVLGTSRIKYVVTLDSDTNLGLGVVRDMCSIMLHPLAKPVIDDEKGIVTDGYGIMQPRCSPDLAAAGATPFSRMMCGEGGSNIYSYAAFDVYQSLFGNGIFCGKGIFDVDAFFCVINRNNTFPEDRILSHDSLEGAKLRSALIADIELTDGFPGHQLSYIKRRHRWVRGDVQNLEYLLPKIRFSKNDIRENNITPLSKFKLFDNVRSALVPVSSFICIFCSMLTGDGLRMLLILSSVLYILVPVILNLISSVSGLAANGITRRFFSKGVTTGLWQSISGMFFTLAMLPSLAISTLEAVLKSFFRMTITHKKLLEWQTAASGDKAAAGLLLYVHKNIFSAISGFMLLVFAPAGFLRALGMLWFAFPVIAYHTSFDRPSQKASEERQWREKARAYASDIWKFFNDHVTDADNHLPPDNIQLAPQEAIAHRTSPTNIGLYLLSVLCARDFGFIDTAELEKRLNSTLSIIEKLEKWHGHLYNWYDTETLGILNPRYISTVDSGNLTACFLTLRMGLRDYVSESTSLLDLIKRIEQLENATDYSLLYNRERDLFSLGADISANGEYTVNNGCYDLMMSEARTISYIQCAKRCVPKKHWTSLSRSLVSSDGYIGLSSWTGTAFEYFMPPLFLPVYKRSLLREAMHFAMREQTKRRAVRNGTEIFGISESAYYSFDSEMNYRYRAFGIPSLAFKAGMERELVISPYSSFLGLCADRRKAFSNIDAMKRSGLYGKYGLYEAVDFTKGRCPENGAVVKSYMSHHMGMSLCALCNAAFRNILCERFMQDSAMNCARELLEERIPVNAVIRRPFGVHTVPSRPILKSTEGKIYTDPNIRKPHTAILSNGNSLILASSSGHISMKNGKYTVNHCNFDRYECTESLFCFAKFADRTLSASVLPDIDPENTLYSMKWSGGCITNTAKIPGLCDLSESLTMSRDEETVFSVKAELTAKCPADKLPLKPPSFCFCFVPVLGKENEYISHTSFSSLFISCEYLREEKILLYKRRPREPGKKNVYLAVAVSDINTDLSFHAVYDECFSTPITNKNFSDVFSDDAANGTSGDLIRPYCKIITSSQKNDSNNFSAEILLCLSESRNVALASINAARKKSFPEKVKVLSEICDKFCSGAGTGMFGSERSPGAVQAILYGCMFGNNAKTIRYTPLPPATGICEIWRHGISGDLPLIAISVISSSLISKLEKYIRAVMLLRICGLKTDLCIIYSEKEKYTRPVYDEIRALIEECDCSELLSKRGGGIFLAERSAYPDSVNAIYSVSCVKIDILYDNGTVAEAKSDFKLRLPAATPVLSVDIPRKEERIISLSCGDFTENGFTVRKDREYKNPMSHILAGRRLCSLVTHNSLGYTWVSNAQNRRITPFIDNPLTDMNGERLLLLTGQKKYDLCAMARYVTYSEGTAVYKGYAGGLYYSISVYVSEKLCVKYCDVSIDFPKGSSDTVSLMYLCTPVMGCRAGTSSRITYFFRNGMLCFADRFSEFFGNYIGFLTGGFIGSMNNVRFITDKAEIYTEGFGVKTDNCDCACAVLDVNAEKGGICRFVLGAYPERMKDPAKILGNAFSDMTEKERSVRFARSLIPRAELIPYRANNLQKAYSVLFNRFLPYQYSAVRFLARSGFYQSSGAFGFRDQLQDSLALMYSKPEMTLSHIYRCCTRQFPEGDVLHWWHECSKSKAGDVVCKGIRSLCSDDYLWLPYAVTEFFIFTGNRDFLQKRIHYASGTPLCENGEQLRERYMEIRKSSHIDTVYDHCKRALDRGISKLGCHGLPLIGSCDWCDGYSNVGTADAGESVWLGMFLCIILEKFCVICKKLSDDEALDRYAHARLDILSAIEKHGYSEKEGQYIRAYFANGEKLGSLECEECKTDLLPQSFAPMAVGLSDERLFLISKNVFERLYDTEYNIFKLFSPAFHASPQEPGYIKGYVPGIRENAGQYTHAAVWGAMGLCRSADTLYRHGRADEAAIIREYAQKAVNAQNTVLRHMGLLGEKAADAYKGEPYYLAGDIYSNPTFRGKSGWTLYTGSASWYYRLIFEYVFGIRLYSMSTAEASLEISNDTPFIDKQLCEGSQLILTPVHGCEYKIKFENGEKPTLTVDGEETVGKIRITTGKHTVRVVRPRS